MMIPEIQLFFIPGEDGALPLKVSVANCTKEDWLCYIRFNAPLEIEMTFNTRTYMNTLRFTMV